MGTGKGYLVTQAMDGIAVPILESIMDLSIKNPAIAPVDNKAMSEKIALLLTKSTQLAISLAKIMDVSSHDESQGDKIRMALTVISSKIIANQYKISGKIPDEQDIEKSIAALRMIIPYAENFSEMNDLSHVLRNLDGIIVDNNKNIIEIIAVGKMARIMDVISDFPFGQSVQKLTQDVAFRLNNDAKMMQQSMVNSATDVEARLSELAILDSLVTIYMNCHSAEKQKLLSNQGSGASADISSVWSLYEERLEMLKLLAISFVSPASTAPVATAPVATAPVATAPVAPEGDKASSSSPMSFFATKPTADSDGDKNDG